MMMSSERANSSEHIVHTVPNEPGKWVMVEHEDLYEKAIDSDALLKEMQYERVEILDNGWIRCITPRDEEERGVAQDETCVDFIPSERVNQIHTVMEDDC